MKICESGPVICRASGQASADTLNETCPCLTCDHEAPIVAGAYCMAGNFVDRNTNQNGCGVRENASFTLNTVDRHAVAYDARHHCLGGEVSGTLQAKGEGGWSLNYINPVLQPLPENTVGIDLYNGAVTGNTAATLTKKNDGTSSGPEVAQRKTPDWIVRRLIPMECGRLQGFPDGWAEIEPLTDLRELPFWREVYTKDCEIKGKKPNRKMMQADSEEGRRALMRWHDGLHSRAAEYAMWGNGMALPNALFFVKNAFRELGKPPGEIKLGSLFDGSGTMPLCAAMCGGHPVWASEVEPYPIAVTKTHLPNMKHLGSVTDMGTHQSHSTKQKGTKRREGRNDKQGNHCGASCGGTCKLHESRSDAEPDHGSGNTEGYLQVHVRGLERRGRRSCRVCRYLAGFSESTGPTGWKIAG